jgi:hypothetical protein
MSYFGAIHQDLPENNDWLNGCTERRYVFNNNGPLSARNFVVDSLNAELFSEVDPIKAAESVLNVLH